jgi:hypothetical protein
MLEKRNQNSIVYWSPYPELFLSQNSNKWKVYIIWFSGDVENANAICEWKI